MFLIKSEAAGSKRAWLAVIEQKTHAKNGQNVVAMGMKAYYNRDGGYAV